MATTADTAGPAAGSRDDPMTMVRPDPQRPGPDRWRVVDGDIAVWAIVQHVQAIGNLDDATRASPALIAETADDYRIPAGAVRAALAYYAANRAAVDAKLAADKAAVSS